jgi:diguanylate cyclase (GGDEF)-like protein
VYLALLCRDLDRLKQVNDSFGHQVGDRLLVVMAGRIEISTRFGENAFGRLGGDAFCILLEGIADKDEAVGTAERVRESPGATFTINDHPISSISASKGIAVKPPGETEAAEQFLPKADAAMYRAKKKGKNRCEVFEEIGMLPRAPRKRRGRWISCGSPSRKRASAFTTNPGSSSIPAR